MKGSPLLKNGPASTLKAFSRRYADSPEGSQLAPAGRMHASGLSLGFLRPFS